MNLLLRIPLLVFLLTLSFSLNLLAAPIDTPRAALDGYLEAAREGDFDAAKAFYTESSRKMFPELSQEELAAQGSRLKSLAERLQAVEFELEQVSPERAVFWASDEKIPPFLVRVQDKEEGWRLDYHFMSRYIQADEKGWSWRNRRVFDIWKNRK
jgi:hypothetical protein